MGNLFNAIPSPYENREEFMERLRQSRRDDIRGALKSAAQLDPDQAGETIDLMKKSGLSRSQVQERPHVARQFAAAQGLTDAEIDFLFEKRPAFTEKLRTDPEFATLASDDIHHTASFEGLLDEIRDYGGDIRKSFGIGVDQYEMSVRGTQWMISALQGQDPNPEVVDRIRELRRDVQRAHRGIEERSFIPETPLTVAEQGPNILGSLAAMAVGRLGGQGLGALIGLIGGPAGATAGSAIGGPVGSTTTLFLHSAMLEGGAAMSEYATITDEQGNKINQETAAQFALATGILAGGVEAASFRVLTRVLPGGLSQKGVGATIRNGMKEVFRSDVARGRVAGAVGTLFQAQTTEGFTEGLQELINITSEELAKVVDPDAFKGANPQDIIGSIFTAENLSQIAESARSGLQVATGLGGPTTAVRIARAPSQARAEAQAAQTEVEAEEAQQRLEQASQQPPPLPELEPDQELTPQPDLAAATKALFQDSAEAGSTEQQTQFIENVRTFASLSQLRERSPEKFREFINEAVVKNTENRDLAILNIDPEGLKSVVEGNPQTFEILDQAIPNLAGQLERGLQTGEPIKADLGGYAAHIATESVHNQLAEHITLRDDAFTASDAEAFQAVLQQEAQTLLEQQVLEEQNQQRAREAFDNVKARIKSELESTGRIANKQSIDSNAAILAQTALHLARRTGKSIDEIVPRITASEETSERSSGTESSDAETGINRLEQPPEGGEKGPRGFFLPNERVIALTPNADLSTFMHEIAHWYVFALHEFSQLPDADASIQQDLDQIFKFVAAENFESMTREQHEQFADAFLKYLSEGKAPTRRLRQAFQNFRKWLAGLFRSGRLQQVEGIELSEEVREVFDRMLAAEEEIADARHETGARPLPIGVQERWMTEEQRRKYQERAEEIAEQALQRRAEQDLKRINKRKTAKYRKQLSAEKKRLRKQIEESRPFQAKQFLMNGKMPDGTTTDDLHRMDHQAVMELLNADEEGRALIKKLPKGKNAITMPEGGLDPDFVAQHFGYSSGDAMLREILPLTEKSINERVEAQARANLDAEGVVEPTIDQGTDADEAVHNASYEQMLLAELEAIEEITQSRRIPSSTLKAYAQGVIAETPVGELRPQRYLQEERRQANKAFKAAAQDNIEEALEARRRQLVNMYLYRQARDKAKRVDRILDNIKRYAKPTIRNKIGEDYTEQIDGILSRFDFRIGPARPTKAQRTISEFVEWQRSLGKPIRVDIDLVGTNVRRNWKTLSISELEGIHDNLRNIELLGKQERELRIRNQRIQIDTMRDAIVLGLKKNIPNPKKHTVTGRKGFEQKSSVLKGFFASMRSVIDFFKIGDGGADGPLHEFLLKPQFEALNQKVRLRREHAEKMDKLFRPYRGKLNKKIRIPGTSDSITLENLLFIGLSWGNNENRSRILELGDAAPGVNADTIDSILDMLEKRDWDTIQEIWDTMDGYFEMMQDLERRTTGKRIKKQEPTTVHTKYGDYRGGYIPIVYDPRATGKTASFEAERLSEQFGTSAGAISFMMAEPGFVKPRVGSGGQKVKLSLDVIGQHVDDVIHHITHRELIMLYARVLRDNAIADTMQQHLGFEAMSEIRDWIGRVAESDRTERDGTARIFSYLRRGIAASVMGFRATTSIVQILGLSQSIATVGPAWIARGEGMFLKALLTGGLPQMVREVHEKSEFMNDRRNTINREVSEAFRNLHKGKFATARDASLYFTIQKMQAAVDIPTWLGAYEKFKSQGKSDEDAILLADKAVIESQGSGRKTDMAGVLATNNEVKRLFTLFYSYFNRTFNISVNSIQRARLRQDPLAVPKLASDFMLLYTVPIIFEGLILDRGPDDDEEWWEWAAKEHLGYIANTSFLVRDAYSAAAFRREAPPGFASPVFGDALVQISQGEIDKPLVRAVTKAGGVLFHLPSDQIFTTVEGFIDLKKGKTDNPAALLIPIRED